MLKSSLAIIAITFLFLSSQATAFMGQKGTCLDHCAPLKQLCKNKSLNYEIYGLVKEGKCNKLCAPKKGSPDLKDVCQD